MKCDLFSRRQVVSGGTGLGLATLLARPTALAAQVRQLPSPADDASIIDLALTALHPGLNRYLDAREYRMGFEQFRRAFNNGPDLGARYLALARLLASIRCGHSYGNFFNQTATVKRALFDRQTRLPFAFAWLGDAMVVTADHGSGADLPPGTRIEAINRIPPALMLRQLMPYVRADGHNDFKRRALLEIRGRDEFETFDIFHGLLFAPPGQDGHHVRYRLPGGERRLAAMPGLTLAQRQAFRPANSNDRSRPLWQWHMRPDGIAVLTMDSWATFNSTWDWKTWLNDRLDSLPGAKGLIVDLRANEGGLDCGNELLARFVAADLPLAGQRRLVRFRTTPRDLDPYLDSWDASFRNIGANAKPFDDRFLELENQNAPRIIAARGPRLTTPMVVLVGPQNSSATFQFAALCRSAGLARLVGEPTGGNQRGINGGAFFFVRLPDSGLEFDLPLIGYYPPGRRPDGGLQPDVLVTRTVADIASRHDAVLALAADLLLR